MSIWKLLGLNQKPAKRQRESPSGAETESVREISETLGRLEPERARYLAAFAYLLSRVAHADQRVSPEETGAMERMVEKWGHLPAEEARLAVQIATRQAIQHGGTENFLVSREFNKLASREQKLELLHSLYAVCAADHPVTSVEEHEIRQISRELLLHHREFISVRLAHRDDVAVLKKR
jgi:uncharacterized tellurite resistance protein B-like protein